MIQVNKSTGETSFTCHLIVDCPQWFLDRERSWRCVAMHDCVCFGGSATDVWAEHEVVGRLVSEIVWIE